MNSEWWISSFIILEFSLPRKAEKRYRCTLFIHHSYWASPHWAFPLTSEALNTESIKRPQYDLALPPCCANLNSLEAPVNSVWAKLSSTSPGKGMHWEFGSQSMVHLLKSLKSVFLSLNSSIVSQYFFSFLFHSKHPSKLICNCNPIYPQFFQKSVWLMILI